MLENEIIKKIMEDSIEKKYGKNNQKFKTEVIINNVLMRLSTGNRIIVTYNNYESDFTAFLY